MKSSVVFLLFISVLFLSACSNKKIERLTVQNDSLKLELKKAQAILANFEEVTASVDAFEGLRKVIPSQAVSKTTHDAMASKIMAINEHVLTTDKQIKSLDHQLKSSRYENSAYVMMVDAVKSELQIRVDEVTILEGNIADIKQQSQKLSIEKEKIVSELLFKVNEKQLALSGLEGRLHRMEANFRNAEAEAVYARAVAVEEAARKTRFAPVKKKIALSEALELYKKARALGKVEADLNIQLLDKTETARREASNLQAL
jgi:hypothetical protein